MRKKIEIELRLAEPFDLKTDDRTLRFGQVYWVRSKQTGQFDNKGYIISEDTDPKELAYWLKEQMLFVPCGLEISSK